MTLLLRSAGRTEIVRSLYRDIYNENDFYYFFVGRTTEWGDEELPETPVDSVRYNNIAHRDMLFVKRIQASDAVLMIPRIDWSLNTVYDQYDDKYGEIDRDGNQYSAHSGATTLKDAIFYVFTDDDHVYKCLSNNGNSPSTIKPTGNSTNPIETDDGYIWKFMLKVEASDKSKFLTTEYIPIRKIAGTGDPAFDVNGEVDNITVVEPGSGYTSTPAVIINGDGVGAVAAAVVSGGEVTDVNIINAGTGYSFAYITFSGGGGSGAEATVSLGATETGTAQENVENAAIPGTIDRIEIVNSGLDYIEGDASVSILGDGSGAEATLTINSDDGSITGVVITNQGSGYTFAEVTVSGLEGSGAELIPVISPRGGHGSNAQKELFATNIKFSVNLTNDSADLFLNNDFRQIGVVKNPLIYNTTNNFRDATGTCSFVVNVDDPENYNMDDVIVTDSGGRFLVVQKADLDNDGITESIYLLPSIPIITNSSVLENTTQSISGLTINSFIEPEVDGRTGEIIYFDNREFIVRQEDQVEKIRAILKF
jgi:hypothetical protein